jgi:hypothetical protein
MFIRHLLANSFLRAPDDDRGAANPDLEQDAELDEGLEADVDPDEDNLTGLDPDDGANPDEPPAQTQSRGDRDYGRLRRERRELETRLEAERTARLEAEARARAQHENEAAERARLAQMEPWEREQHEQRQRENRRDREIADLRLQNWSSNDRAAFRDRCEDVPAYRQIRSEVEDRFNQAIRDGRPVDRETIAKFLIGERAVARATKVGKKTERQAAETRARQQAQPGTARGGAAARPGGDKARQSLRERLKDVQI